MDIHIVAFIFNDDKLLVPLPSCVMTGVPDDHLRTFLPDITVLNTPPAMDVDNDQRMLASPAFAYEDKGKLYFGYVCSGCGPGQWLTQDALTHSDLSPLLRQCAFHAFSVYQLVR